MCGVSGARVDRCVLSNLMMRHLCLFFLKCGSGNRKNILLIEPLAKKLGRYFIALCRITDMF